MEITSHAQSSSAQSNEEAITAKQIAPLIGCAIPTVYKMAAASKIPFVAIGVGQRGRRFYLSAVKAALGR